MTRNYVYNEKTYKKYRITDLSVKKSNSYVRNIVDGFLKQNSDNLSRILTNPTDIIGSLDNLLITNLVLILIVIASASTNLIANFIPSQYSLINLMPSSGESIQRGERGMDTTWMPYMWPIKTCLLIGIIFLLVQGVSELFKSYWAAKKGQWPGESE